MIKLPENGIVVKHRRSNNYAAIMPAAHGKHVVITPWAMQGITRVMEWYISERYVIVDNSYAKKIESYAPMDHRAPKPDYN